MSRFGSTSYNPTGNSGGSDNDYKDRDSMLLSRYAIIELDLARVGVYDGDYGRNMILNMDDVEVIEGVITERDDETEKTKVFGWDKWYDRDEETHELIPHDEEAGITEDDLPRVASESAGGDNYKYTIEEAVLEGRDDPVDISDRELWLGNGKKTRTLAKVLSERGEDVIGDKDDDYDWLDAEGEDEFELRDELEGRRMMLWFENVTIPPEDLDEDQDEPITFTDAVLLDAETETGITMKNDDSDGEGDTESDEGSSDETDDADESSTSSEETGDFPDEIEEFIDMFARNGQTNRENIENIVRDEAPEDYEVDMDAVMEEIESRM